MRSTYADVRSTLGVAAGSSGPTPAGRRLAAPQTRSDSDFLLGAVRLSRLRGVEYAVKLNRPDQPRARSSDQVVGRLGLAIGAPVVDVGLMDVPAAYLPPAVDPAWAGIGHASVLILDATDRMDVQHVAPNADRFGALAVLYTWASQQGNADRQVIYDRMTHVMYSVDHGHFLPPENGWRATTLDHEPNPTVLDPWVMASGIDLLRCRMAESRLASLKRRDIAAAVAAIPAAWAVPTADQVALCRFLWRRRRATLSILQGGSPSNTMV